MRYALLFFSFTLLWIAAPAQAAKPRQPLQVKIVPVQANYVVQPGETVDLKVYVRTSIETKELRFKLEFQGNASLVSGSSSWVGPAAKGEEKMFPVTVRIGPGGGSRLRAHAAIFQSQTATFSASAEHVFENVVREKQAPPPKRGQDILGRQIKEYRNK